MKYYFVIPKLEGGFPVLIILKLSCFAIWFLIMMIIINAGYKRHQGETRGQQKERPSVSPREREIG
jgi:hypothetical protein